MTSLRSSLLVALMLLPPLGAAAVRAAEGAAPVDAVLVRAREAFEKEKYRRALDLFLEADRESGGTSITALLGASASAVRSGSAKDGIALARRAVALPASREDHAVALQLLGLALLRGEESLEEAEAALLAALAGNPAARPAHLYLAELYGKQGEMERAVGQLDRFVEKGGDRASAAEVRSRIEPLGQPPAAFEACLAELRARGWEVPEPTAEPGSAVVVEPEAYQAPQPVATRGPDYPEAARLARRQGTVVLRTVVSETGGISCLTVRNGIDRDLTAAAVRAVWGWRFDPARIDGRAVPVLHNLFVNFKLQ